MRVALSGGGSAGHVTPTLAVSEMIRALDPTVEQLYIGQAGSMEERIVKATGLAFAPIRAGKFRRHHFQSKWRQLSNLSTLGPNARDALRTVAGVADAIRVLRRFKPDVVFIKGGFVVVPVGLAARILGIPYVIHESDIVPGLANKILAPGATHIAVGFPAKYYQNFGKRPLEYVGNPVRQEIVSGHRLTGLGAFHLSDNLPTVLITGGSQGAQQINDVVLEALPELVEFCQIIHQTGDGEAQRIEFELKRRPALAHPERYHAQAFITRHMGDALAAADVVVGRAGVGTISDSAVLGKPTILIPNYEMAGHQVANARALSRSGAALVLDGRKLTAGMFASTVRALLLDEERQHQLSTAIRQFGKPEAAHDLAEIVLGQARSPHAAQKPNTTEDHS